jgi:ribonuclease HI
MTNSQQQQQSIDQLSFDGSAEPNPGGRMGAGWRLVFTDRPEETGSAEWPAARDSTNNRAEYLALIGALEQYLASGRPGPLRVQGDSQLVLNQMTGEWGINNPALWSLNRQATALAKRIPGGVRYRWIPREENQVADTLASGQAGVTQTPLVYAEQPQGGVAKALAEQVALLNQTGKMSFKEAMGLRVGGMDQYSRWHLPELVTAVGASGLALIDAAFPGQDAEAIKTREAALRWMVRGLAAQLAIRKVQVDQEVQANRRQKGQVDLF